MNDEKMVNAVLNAPQGPVERTLARELASRHLRVRGVVVNERAALARAVDALDRLAERDGWRVTPREPGESDEWESAESQALRALAVCRAVLAAR